MNEMNTGGGGNSAGHTLQVAHFAAGGERLLPAGQSFSGVVTSPRALSAKVERSLSHQAPAAEQVGRISLLRDAAKLFAVAIESNSSPSREQALAVTKLEESLMWAIKGVVLEPHPAPRS